MLSSHHHQIYCSCLLSLALSGQSGAKIGEHLTCTLGAVGALAQLSGVGEGGLESWLRGAPDRAAACPLPDACEALHLATFAAALEVSQVRHFMYLANGVQQTVRHCQMVQELATCLPDMRRVRDSNTGHSKHILLGALLVPALAQLCTCTEDGAKQSEAGFRADDAGRLQAAAAAAPPEGVQRVLGALDALTGITAAVFGRVACELRQSQAELQPALGAALFVAAALGREEALWLALCCQVCCMLAGSNPFQDMRLLPHLIRHQCARRPGASRWQRRGGNAGGARAVCYWIRATLMSWPLCVSRQTTGSGCALKLPFC